MKVESASVKVMRSYDYCHFEVCLSASDIQGVVDVDGLRKLAARLADKAVEQYETAKHNAELISQDGSRLVRLRWQGLQIEKKPEGERTPEDVAILKQISDLAHRNRRRYDYEDDFEESNYEDEDQEIF